MAKETKTSQVNDYLDTQEGLDVMSAMEAAATKGMNVPAHAGPWARAIDLGLIDGGGLTKAGQDAMKRRAKRPSK